MSRRRRQVHRRGTISASDLWAHRTAMRRAGESRPGGSQPVLKSAPRELPGTRSRQWTHPRNSPRRRRTPTNLAAHALRLLARGAADRRAAFHTPTLSTVGLDGRPRARTVVMRGLDVAGAAHPPSFGRPLGQGRGGAARSAGRAGVLRRRRETPGARRRHGRRPCRRRRRPRGLEPLAAHGPRHLRRRGRAGDADRRAGTSRTARRRRRGHTSPSSAASSTGSTC